MHENQRRAGETTPRRFESTGRSVLRSSTWQFRAFFIEAVSSMISVTWHSQSSTQTVGVL